MHVCIRPWTAADAPAIVEALSDAGVTDNLRDGLPKPYTEADARDYIAYARTAGEGAYAFAIDAGGEAAGSIQLTRQGNIHRVRRSSAITSSAASGAEGCAPRP